MPIDLAALPDDVETLQALIGDLVRAQDSARGTVRGNLLEQEFGRS